MSKSKYFIIADDFTGSNDTGVQLKNNGIDIEVMLFPRDSHIDHSIVLDTESRTIPAKQAFIKVKKMVTEVIKNNQFDLVYKKVDSTIRGNIGEEIHALLDVYQPDKVIFAPAFPEIGRTTVSGIHRLNGVRLMETEIAKDPLNPIWTDDLTDIVTKEFGDDYMLHSTDSLKPTMVLSKNRFHIFDIESEEQLLILAEVLRNTDGKVLYVGSAGLASAIFTPTSLKNPVFSVIGSISEVSLKQMDYAATKGVNILTIDLNDLVKNNVEEIYAEKVIASLNAKKDTVLTVTRSKEDYYRTIKRFQKLGMDDKFEVSRIIKTMLARITGEIIQKAEISGLFLTGGDTAIEVVHTLGASGCRIQRELFTGIVESTLVGGKYSGLDIVTKAGAFGNEDAMYQSIQELKKGR